MNCIILIALIGLFLIPTRGSSEPEAGRLQLFLLIGQSNMAGRGKVEPRDQIVHPQILMFTKTREWLEAIDPLHFDKLEAGVGLGSEFARQIVAANPKATVGLIPCAMGGSKLDEWTPEGALYKNAVSRTRAAMKNGTLAGILWHQGESDSSADKVASYAERFAVIIGHLRNDLSAENVPVIVGELGRFRQASAGFNAALPRVVGQVPHCVAVSSEGLSDKGDQLHFNSESLRILGQRYAVAFLELRARISNEKSGNKAK